MEQTDRNAHIFVNAWEDGAPQLRTRDATSGSQRVETGGNEQAFQEGDEQEEEQEDAYFEDSDESGWSEDESWVQNYLAMDGNELFVEVDDDFIRDDFNLTGLSAIVPYYHYALDILLDSELQDDVEFTEEQQYLLRRACEELYGLVHARFILTGRGLTMMHERFHSGKFGYCPRYICQNQSLLPVGLSDVPRQETVKMFCPKCEDVFHAPRRYSHIDGAFFGTTFAHMLLQVFPSSIPVSPSEKYVPRIFGFKIHHTAKARLRELASKAERKEQSNAAPVAQRMVDANEGQKAAHA